MAAGRCNVSSPKKRAVPHPKPEKGFGFGKLSGCDCYGVVEGGFPHEKRRKVLRDGWSREDDKEVRISSRNRVVSTNASVSLLETVGDSECRAKQEVEADGALGTDEARASWHSHKSLGRVEVQRVGMWKGFTSRWEDMEVDYDDVARGRSDSGMSSPESGEIVGGNRKSSGFEGEGDKYSANSLGNDSMETDERSEEVTGDSLLDSDSEGYDDCSSKGRSISMLQGCRSAYEYEKLYKISEGTYGVVYKAKDKLTGDVVALKKVKMGKNVEGFPITSLREINILMSLRHPAIVDVKEVVMDDHGGVYVVMEYMEHDLRRVMDVMKQPFSQSDVKCLMLQLLKGVKFLHDNWVLHRDLKTSNLLFNNRGELKICDFGMARQYGSPLKPYTSLVVTLWYRAPEVLLGAKQYSTAVDMWSVGCIMAEMLSKEVLFRGEAEIQQLHEICKVLGTPNDAVWPGFSSFPGSKAKFVKQPYNKLREKFPAATFTGSPVLTELGFDLLSKLLTYDPAKRITAEEALKHGWFDEVPLPKSKEFMPTFPVPNGRL